MEEKKLQKVLATLEGMNHNEWAQIKMFVDHYYSSKANEIKFDDFELMERMKKTMPFPIRQ
jgi:hypothetical protein